MSGWGGCHAKTSPATVGRYLRSCICGRGAFLRRNMFSFDEMVLKQLTERSGFPARVGHVKSNPFMGRLLATDFEISNPDGYPLRDFLSLAEFRIHLSPSSLFGKTIKVKELEIHLRSLTGVRSESGAINFEHFRQALEEKDEAIGEHDGPRREVECERLVVKVDHIATVDYGKGSQERQDYPVLFHHEYRDVSNWNLVAPPLVRHLEAGGLSRVDNVIFATLLPVWLWAKLQEIGVS